METTKYYFEKESLLISEKDECLYFNRKILSIECRKCDNCKGYDKEEKWIKCLMYQKENDIMDLLTIIQKVVKERNDLKDELYFLKGGL